MTLPRPRAALLQSAVALLFCSSFAVATVAPSTARAAGVGDDAPTRYRALTVQQRKFDMTHEIGVQLGFLPLDAFQKGFTLSADYTFHFDELIAWEVAKFMYSFPMETELNDDLGAFGLQPTPFEVVQYVLTTNFVFKPLYFKGALLNSAMIYGEILLVLGGGYGWFTRSGRPALDLGVALRLFASELFSFRLDTRYLMFFAEDAGGGADVHSELWIGLGTSVSF